jgi:hypothetical protein
MNLTKTQSRELLNQHVGTGYMFIHTADNTYKIVEIYVGKNGIWHSGNDNKLLADRLTEISNEINNEV